MITATGSGSTIGINKTRFRTMKRKIRYGMKKIRRGKVMMTKGILRMNINIRAGNRRMRSGTFSKWKGMRSTLMIRYVGRDMTPSGNRESRLMVRTGWKNIRAGKLSIVYGSQNIHRNVLCVYRMVRDIPIVTVRNTRNGHTKTFSGK